MKRSIQRAAESVTPSLSAAGDVEKVYVKIAKRIIPFMALLFLMAWLDRYNLGFAKLQMTKDLGFRVLRRCRAGDASRPGGLRPWQESRETW